MQPTAGRQPADRLPVGRAIARQTRMPGGVGGVMGAIPSPRPDWAYFVLRIQLASIGNGKRYEIDIFFPLIKTAPFSLRVEMNRRSSE